MKSKEKAAAERVDTPIDVLTEARLALEDPSLTAESLRDILARVTIAEREAAVAASQAEAFKAELFDASEETFDDIERSIVLHRRRESRLAKAAELLKLKIVEADGADREAARLARYEEADRLRQETESWIREHYRTHATAIAEGLARHAEIVDVIAAANADRPRGMPYLTAEGFRDLLPSPGETTFVTETYYVDREGKEIPLTSGLVLSREGVGNGELYITAAGAGAAAGVRVLARTREVARQGETTPGASPRPLDTSVFLPRILYEEQDFWPRRSAAW